MDAVDEYGSAAWTHGFDETVEAGRERFDAYQRVLDIAFERRS